MATKTFEELKQLAIQIRDEKTNKQNTATRIGTQMLEHLDKLEQDYYDKTATDEELKERDEKLTELERKNSVLDNNISILRKTLEIEGIEGTGYMSSSNSLALGSFGKHCIYSSIPANIQAKVSTPEGSAGSYYYHLTDVDDNILETFKSGDYIYGYTFKKYDIITKLYASVPSGVKQNIEFGTFYPINALVKEVDCKATFAQNFSDINKVQSIFKTGTKYTGGFETGIYKNDLTYNSAIQFIKTTNILKAESSADYNT